MYRNMVLAATGADRDIASAALEQKIRSRLDLLRAAPELPAAIEIGFVSSQGPDDQPSRRFVRPMSTERARLELELGIDGAMIFVDENTGTYAVVSHGEAGDAQLLSMGEPVHGDGNLVRTLPVPERTPARELEPSLRASKAQRVRELLHCPSCREKLEEQEDALKCASCDRTFANFAGKPMLALNQGYDPSPKGQPESQNPYGQQVLSLIEKYRDGWVLDCGSGSPRQGFYNVVHLELFGYPEVDVVTDGEALPFADQTFDAVLSEAVLEHVRDPIAYTREVARVLKPGGLLYLDAAFMTPYHGYPDHYYNMTKSGMQITMEKAGLEILSLMAGEHQHPFITLSNVLNYYSRGTPDKDKRERFHKMTIDDAIDKLASGGGDPFDGLTKEAIDTLAAGFSCIARRPV